MPAWLDKISTRFQELRTQAEETLAARNAPRVHLGAFGKHPAWDDHVDDLGVDTEALLAARQYLYVQGIGGLIDAGAWESLPEGDALPAFKHVFLWVSGDDLLIGRLWSSSDGKGRTLYPMILCAQIERAIEAHALPWMLARLAAWETECRGTTSADEVRRIIHEGSLSAQDEANRIPVPPEFSATDFMDRIQLNADGEALPRIAYAVDAYLGAFAPGKVNRRELGLHRKLGQAKLQPQHLRLPADATDTLASLQFWRTFLSPSLDPAVPLLFLAPLDQPWIDLIAGPLTTKHLICLRSAPSNVPLTSEVPFNITDDIRTLAITLANRVCALPVAS